ncbi:MAG: hypothetical protein F6K09_10660 [Merismopedia sp. SIO2A8]|nr:hypothetical protein [Merismopedia sp. SIO2A8]
MIHGLMWFPLLVIFIGLAWAGWNEYQKVEQYKVWVAGAERAKYDIRAALMQKDGLLIWGTPSRSGILDIQTLSVTSIDRVSVTVDHQTIDLAHPPEQGKAIALELTTPALTSTVSTSTSTTPTASTTQSSPISIPFTDISLAIQWAMALKHDCSCSQ